jgi:uncharacterized repeat protein (TIGR03803 family)
VALNEGKSMMIDLRTVSAALALVIVLGLGVVRTQAAQAPTVTVLYNFTGLADGGYPQASLVWDAARENLFGTTQGGGAYGQGTVFKLDPTGKETALYSFTGGTDGSLPYSGLVWDKAGNLYGTTEQGGAYGQGTVFNVSKSGKETVLHSFTGSDGCFPLGGLLRDKVGNLYGTTYQCGASGYGTVFKVNTSGTETVLHSFTGLDGKNPVFTSLLMDTEGNLYGVTLKGGASDEGVVYKLSQSRKLTVLHSFSGGTTDGCYSYGTLVNDAKGNLYGTTQSCGASGDGMVYKLSKTGRLSVLYSFTGIVGGGGPVSGVIRDSKGNLYGDTHNGGTSQLGTVYKLSQTGRLTMLYSFSFSDGENPNGALIQDNVGNVYGTASLGGSGSSGTVWKLTP